MSGASLEGGAPLPDGELNAGEVPRVLALALDGPLLAQVAAIKAALNAVSAAFVATMAPLRDVLARSLRSRRRGASLETLYRRVRYGGRKGRSALRRLQWAWLQESR
jgi:hypothetical protein